MGQPYSIRGQLQKFVNNPWKWEIRSNFCLKATKLQVNIKIIECDGAGWVGGTGHESLISLS